MNSFKDKDEKIRGANEQEPQSKKPYRKPAFRFERVFEVSALGCTKNKTQFGCGKIGKS
jgi:hypothetical protein